ncbi:TELO2-interacting protein 1 homolog isoform X2 [Zophobas morio]|uniref:TELO2-interacting protein 1 homolog isoform X2 n=1 Tax=Zophobas morio TaxID=2755281 RepID=UPI0030833893
MDPKDNHESIEQLTRMKIACSRIFQNQKDVESVKELQNLIRSARPTIVKTLEPLIFSVFFPVLKSISEPNSSFKEKDKQQVVDTFKVFFEKISIEKLPLFFNIYGFLLFEIYDHLNHSVLKISEEYKLSIVECMTALAKCLKSSLIAELYVKENAPKLCQMIYVVLEVAKNEQFRALRIAAINCIMAIAHVLDDHDFSDLVMRDQIAEVFLFFLPGVASQLKSIALIDEKYGHKVPSVALKAWGRIVTLLMQDYNACDRKIHLNQPTTNPKLVKTRWKDENELKQYIKNTQRSPEWYKETDKKLQQIIVEFAKLTHHSHPNVRMELVNMASLLLENCVHTMPTSISHVIDIIIILSEDCDSFVSQKSKSVLDDLSQKLVTNEYKALLDNLEESFYGVVTSMPRKFNGIDERVQIVALNSLIGYVDLFGKHCLTRILHSTVHLNRLVLTLIHVCEFNRSDVSTLEEYTTTDYDLNQDLHTSWKKFRHFKDVVVLKKIETVCRLLAKYGATPIVTDFLLDIIISEPEQRKEAIFLLNEVVAGIELNDDHNFNIVKNVVSTYVDSTHWYLPLSVMIDEYGYEHTLGDVQTNIIQVCLLVEGIGKVASILNTNFKQFLLKTLYLVLERAGSAHPLVRSAGLLALSDISKACGCHTITELINNNIDYFSFHIERKLNRGKENAGGLDVLAVVIQYSTKEVLNSTCDVVKELLLRTYDNRSNLNSYLHVFKMFVCGLHKWLRIETVDAPFKTKKQKQEEFEDFRVSNIEPIEDFSDGVMGKSAEEMYKEDMEKSRSQIEQECNEPVEEYKKPEPPTHIKLTVAILSRTLHYLPSKNQTRKLLVLEILKNGLPVLKEWEDELLPIVHQIWSPLVDRFKEGEDAVIVNYSFRLLVVLAKLSKEFIRSRTAKEVLPNVLTILDKLAKESYLKDKGSAYRYSQNYKLQCTILENLAPIVTDLDMLQQDFDKTMETVFKYVSDKQPIPLQKSALVCFETLVKYDPKSAAEKINSLVEDAPTEFEKNVAVMKREIWIWNQAPP